MISLRDMLALLDKIPAWKQLKKLPSRVEELEKRIEALEKTPAATDDVCPKCKKRTFELISTRQHPELGEIGVLERVYRCSACDFEEPKMIEP